MFKLIHYNAPVILTYTLLALLALFLGALTQGASTVLLFSVYRSALSDPLTYVRMFGHALGHISMEHFAGNFMIILLIGPILEEKYGSLRLLLVMLMTTLVTGLLNVMLFDTALLGASGVVFTLIILGSFANVRKGAIPLTFILMMCIFVGRALYDSFYATGNVSHLTHVIGGICGAVVGFWLNRNPKGNEKDKKPVPVPPDSPAKPIKPEDER